MIKEPQISVVMPVFNGEKYLAKAIKSILTQTFNDLEFIIIDDGSTDSSAGIIQTFKDERIVYVKQTNAGIAVALNNGIKISKGRYIARMDQDDISDPNRLTLQFNFLESHKEYTIVGSNAEVMDMNEHYVFTSKLPITDELIKAKFPYSSFFHSSVMFRKTEFEKVGGYDEEISKFNCFEDSILWNKLQHFGKMANLETALIKYRLVPSAASTKSGKYAKIINRVFIEIVNEQKINEKNKAILLGLKQSVTPNEKLSYYYLHLSKKYLLNNYQPKRVRKYSLQSIKLAPLNLESYLVFLSSMIPGFIFKRLFQTKIN